MYCCCLQRGAVVLALQLQQLSGQLQLLQQQQQQLVM
jgi:hypothetical protein